MVAPEEIDPVRVEYLQAEKIEDGFKRIVSSVDKVTHEHIFAVRNFTPCISINKPKDISFKTS